MGTSNIRLLISDVERILEDEQQFLDEDDDESRISIRPFTPPTKDLLVTAEKSLNARMVKNFFKKHGEIEQCVKVEDSNTQFIVTFVDAQGKLLLMVCLYKTHHMFGDAVVVL